MRLLLILSISTSLISGCQVTVGGSSGNAGGYVSKSFTTGMSDDRRP